MRPTTVPPAEHDWHACTTPPPPDNPATAWPCPICGQPWRWRRPPRPAAQWVRATTEEN